MRCAQLDESTKSVVEISGQGSERSKELRKVSVSFSSWIFPNTPGALTDAIVSDIDSI